MSTLIPTVLPKLLALAGSSQPFEARNALRMARAKLQGDWSVVIDLTEWMLDGEAEYFEWLLERVATSEDNVESVKALADAQRLMRTVEGLSFDFLSRKVGELRKAQGAAKIRRPAAKNTSTPPAEAPPAPPVTEAVWAEVFAECHAANLSRAAQRDPADADNVVQFRRRRRVAAPPRPPCVAQPAVQLAFDFACPDTQANSGGHEFERAAA
jgi:hypothetical protein